ncbi:molybdenum cofactor guanylyltransferase [Paenibacillus sp. DYY-L-2]|uniref:molybdenum cofactor guanylyltransferase n=1 Tax=Paenibacillus sp. DYY-L-2 TaxID=3447013 RepID=UPI003F4F6642
MKITAIILAGGRSTRMGRNKALLPVGGVPVIERLVRELDGVADRILIAGGGHAEAYRYLGLETVQDAFPNSGPLAGLHAGLAAARTPWVLAVACDMPFVSRGAFRWLAERTRLMEVAGSIGDPVADLEAVIPSLEGRVQPLLAAYRRSVLPGLERELAGGNLKMTRWVEGLKAEYVDGAELAEAAGMPPERLPFNMNRPGDVEQAEAWLKPPL